MKKIIFFVGNKSDFLGMKGGDNKKKMGNYKFTLGKIIISIFIIIFIASLCFLIKNYIDYKQMNESMEELKEDVIKEDTQEKTSTTINWKKLKEINENIVGWIKINNTNINYPILQTNDLYYLKHNYMKKYNSNGSIFTMDYMPFEQQETVVHGHNMKNNIMFSELSNYLNKDFFNSNNTFEIYTPKNNYKATIFSAYSIGVNIEENNIKSLNFEEEIEYYKNKSKYCVSNIENIKKIVKLSTCSYLNSRRVPTDQRYYIVA